MIEILLWIIFVGSAILLSVVILLQEAKGGGLAEAFGGMGAQTFGVKASGINKFTAYVAAVFLLSAILISLIRKGDTTVFDTGPSEPIQQEESEGPGGFTPPADNTDEGD